MEKQIEKAIQEAVKEFVSKKWDEHIEQLKKEKDVYVAGIALNLMREVNISTFSDNVTITIKNKNGTT